MRREPSRRSVSILPSVLELSLPKLHVLFYYQWRTHGIRIALGNRGTFQQPF